MRGVYLASVWIHILAAMTWVGGMLAFVLMVMPYFRHQPEAARTAFMEWFGPRFGAVSWICLAVLAATGTFNLWVRGVRLDDFLRPEWRATTFGHLLLIKLVLVVTVAAVSFAHARPALRPHARALGRALLVASLAIVALAAMLVRAI